MSFFTDLTLFFTRKAKETLRNPVYLSMGIGTPILYLFLFAPLLKSFVGSQGFPTENIFEVFIPGMAVMIAFFSGLFSGWGMIDELQNGVIERFYVSPCSRGALLGGFVLRDLFSMLLQVTAFLAFSTLFGYRLSIAGLMLLYVVLSLLLITVSSFANGLGLLVRRSDILAPIVQGINLPTMLLSGVLLPMSLAPLWLKVVAHSSPMFYAVEAARALQMADYGNPYVLYCFLLFLPLSCLAFLWTTTLFKKAVV